MSYELYMPVEGGGPVAFRYEPATRQYISKDGGRRILKEEFKQGWKPAPAAKKAAPKKAAPKK